MDEIISKLYFDFLEHQPAASESLHAANRELQAAFEHFLSEYDRTTFAYAYKLGFSAGKSR